MASIDEELLLDAEDDARTVAYIRSHLPAEASERLTDEDLYYMLDVIIEYYATSGILDATPDADGYIDIDEGAIATHVMEQARKDHMGDYLYEDIVLVVEAEGDYAEEQEQQQS